MINRLLKCTLVVLIITVSQAYSAPPDSTSVGMTIYNDVKEGAGTVYNDVKEALGQFASALKVGSEHVYKVLVAQQAVKSTFYLTLFLIGAVLVYVCIWTIRKMEYKTKYNEYDKEETTLADKSIPLIPVALCAGIASLFFIAIGVCNMDVILTGFINPEYGAMQEIIEVLKDTNRYR